MASRVEQAAVPAYTGAAPAAVSTVISLTRRRSLASQVGELAGSTGGHDPVHAPSAT